MTDRWAAICIDRQPGKGNCMTEKRVVLDSNAEAAFSNQVDYCVGTGRMGLALHQEYQEQLKLVQEYIGFSHIRGHGLFSDDMAIYQEGEDGSPEYNYTYLDRVICLLYTSPSPRD